MIYRLGDVITPIQDVEEIKEAQSKLYIVKYSECAQILEELDIYADVEIDKKLIEFSKIEVQQDCIVGTLAAPKLLDVLGKRYRLLFFVDKNNIVIADDDDFAYRIVCNIQRERTHQGQSVAQFIYYFMIYLMKRDNILLEKYEDTLMKLEERIVNEKIQNIQNEIVPLRKELLTLRNYYDQLMDMGEELEDNENNFFTKKNLRYFAIITNRAARYKEKTIYLLDYASQVKDAYHEIVATKQNNNMQFLTIISTIFLPLTLITSWYGMNFNNMPELRNGYPYVIFLCVVVVIISIIIFKKKKII